MFPYTVTFLLGLFWSVEMGLIVGCVLHLALLLYQQSKPEIQVTKKDSYTLFAPQTDLAFPGVEHRHHHLHLHLLIGFLFYFFLSNLPHYSSQEEEML